jgi:hypothetical protein
MATFSPYVLAAIGAAQAAANKAVKQLQEEAKQSGVNHPPMRVTSSKKRELNTWQKQGR